MELFEINPFIRYANLHEFFPKEKENSICYDCRLFFVCEGFGSLMINDIDYNFSKDTVVFLPPKTTYKFSFETGSNIKVYVINFDLTCNFSNIKESVGTAPASSFDYKKLLITPTPLKLKGVIVLGNLVGIKQTVKKIINEFANSNSYYLETSSTLMKICLIDIVKAKSLGVSNIKILSEIQNYIYNNYSNPDLSNKDIAEHFYYHPYYLSQLFKSITGVSLYQYLINYRINVAKSHLVSTAFTVDEIAWKTGFCSTSHFIKTFRLKIGQTPLKYRSHNTNLLI